MVDWFVSCFPLLTFGQSLYFMLHNKIDTFAIINDYSGQAVMIYFDTNIACTFIVWSSNKFKGFEINFLLSF